MSLDLFFPNFFFTEEKVLGILASLYSVWETCHLSDWHIVAMCKFLGGEGASLFSFTSIHFNSSVGTNIFSSGKYHVSKVMELLLFQYIYS